MTCKRFTSSLGLGVAICMAAALTVDAQETIVPPFAGSYSLNNIGSPSAGVPAPLGVSHF